ncbi:MULTISPECIES: nucleotide 5'-monophosphate nucleosidase PpnN [Alteromonadaceae]|uniref:nucleotide 5'-monophosphate nucleosidase PpnN n=1 Tax=Alteromonadaceae TaxID=72275 RepID=UPI0026DB1485|nr:nucleotide 5'-monophosphate nucleosidase PpnN [Alteromonas sp. LMIT006]
MTKNPVQLSPVGWMSQLSQNEMALITDHTNTKHYQLFRNCVLAVLNSGAETDDMTSMLDKHQSFAIDLIRRERGVKIELLNPPQEVFVDGKLISGVHEHVFAVMRDLLYVESIYPNHSTESCSGSAATDMVFDMLRHANALEYNDGINTVVCWGGHSIGHTEYRYTKEVGYQLGLRGFDICTGCGPGAMKGPMKGAAIGHAKQRIKNGRYVGLTEPSIIAAEPPNAIVNKLVILPDIEKRLEAFVRFGHAIVVFPGGVGTAEELLYLLGILLHSKNQSQQVPLILTGPKETSDYFEAINAFVAATLGIEATQKYRIIVDDAKAVAQHINNQREVIRNQRLQNGDAFSFNWSLQIEPEFQIPFVPTHENMANLHLHRDQSSADLAANLRKVFSGIVAGNIKADTIAQIAEKGKFKLTGDPELITMVERLLEQFIAQGRMKLPGKTYEPCYEIVKN